MESSHTFPKRIDLNDLCQEILNESIQLQKYIEILNINPDWIEENCTHYLDTQLLSNLIDISYTNKQYIVILYSIIDVLRENFITDEIFTKLVNYPDNDICEHFKIQLSHKSLNEIQLLYLCQFQTIFECYFELAILYYKSVDIHFKKFKNFLLQFKNTKFSYMYKDLLQELLTYKSSTPQKERWLYHKFNSSL